MMARLLLLLPLLSLHSVLAASHNTPDCVLLQPNPSEPDGAPVELGKEFTVTCLLRPPLKADDIVWEYNNGRAQVELPKHLYRKINDTAGTITFNVTEDMAKDKFFTCSVKNADTLPHNNCRLHKWGILLDKGYPPQVPTDVTCEALQEGIVMSNNVTCKWNPGSRDPRIRTTYTLYIEVSGQKFHRRATRHSGTVALEVFPHHEDMRIWVEVVNALGNATSEIIEEPAENTIKTNPPANVKIPEPAFSKSLLVQWKPAIAQTYVRLKYEIRYRERDSRSWQKVPQEDTKDCLDSFRLQGLKPDMEYVVEVRCKTEDDLGYWSDWSKAVTKRTTEDSPSSAPDILVKAVRSSADAPALDVQLLLKKPVESNGKILAYNITILEKGTVKQVLTLPYQAHQPFQTYDFNVPVQKDLVASVQVTANNSVGVSPLADMAVPLTVRELPAVEDLVVYSQNDTFQVEWSHPAGLQGPGLPSEYIVEWRSLPEGQWNWQREPRNVTKTHIRGNDLRPFVPYNVTVTPIYKRQYQETSSPNIIVKPSGNPKTVTLYLREGVPVAVPVVDLVRTWKHSAELKWTEIPLEKRRGFINNFTVFYESEGQVLSETVPPNVHRLTLTNLQKYQYYTIRLVASTVAGAKSSDPFNMRTAQYDPGEIEMIVVAVCFGFLFLTMLTLRICFKNKETLKKKFWPQVPDPYNSTVAKWSPDLSARASSPKESPLGDLSVVEVDVFERRSLCGGGGGDMDDKASLAALKKDKYLSEEHSSGIGGSSCMSSPRQSVSDSDEADSGQTTGSLVQYSAVVGQYKGQTPGGGAGSSSSSSSSSSSAAASNNNSSSSSSSSSSDAAGINGGGNSTSIGANNATTPATTTSSSQAHTFARSESTQPLLECEEQQEGSGPHHQHHHQGGRAGSLFRRQPHHLGDVERGDGGGSGGSMRGQHPSEQEEQDCGSLEFCPVEDASEPTQLPAAATSGVAGAADHLPLNLGLGRPAYMPQQSGYRPQ